MVRCDPEDGDFGSVVVVGPIDRRVDWYFVSDSLGEFLTRYIEARGEMFWQYKQSDS